MLASRRPNNSSLTLLTTLQNEVGRHHYKVFTKESIPSFLKKVWKQYLTPEPTPATWFSCLCFLTAGITAVHHTWAFSIILQEILEFPQAQRWELLLRTTHLWISPNSPLVWLPPLPDLVLQFHQFKQDSHSKISINQRVSFLSSYITENALLVGLSTKASSLVLQPALLPVENWKPVRQILMYQCGVLLFFLIVCPIK